MTRSTVTRAAASFVILLIVLPLGATNNTQGIFRGTLVENPKDAPATGFVYLRSRNGNVRRVETSKAVVAYDESVPKEQQTTAASEALKPGTDVRVTASQEADGEWHASRIDILGNETAKPSSEDSDDPDDSYQLDPPGSHRPVIRKS